jgi:hypothetical protein
VLHSRGDVSCWHRSRPSPLHKSAFRSCYIVPFVISFFHHCLLPLFGYTDVSHSRIFSFAHRSCYLSSYSSILSHLTISIVVCCLKLKLLVLYYCQVNSNLIDDEC